MSRLPIPNDLAEKVQRIAEREQRSVEEVLRAMIQQYEMNKNTSSAVSQNTDPLIGLLGLLDDEIDVTDHGSM